MFYSDISDSCFIDYAIVVHFFCAVKIFHLHFQRTCSLQIRLLIPLTFNKDSLFMLTRKCKTKLFYGISHSVHEMAMIITSERNTVETV